MPFKFNDTFRKIKKKLPPKNPIINMIPTDIINQSTAVALII